jgi:hypothetical protein
MRMCELLVGLPDLNVLAVDDERDRAGGVQRVARGAMRCAAPWRG